MSAVSVCQSERMDTGNIAATTAKPPLSAKNRKHRQLSLPSAANLASLRNPPVGSASTPNLCTSDRTLPSDRTLLQSATQPTSPGIIAVGSNPAVKKKSSLVPDLSRKTLKTTPFKRKSRCIIPASSKISANTITKTVESDPQKTITPTKEKEFQSSQASGESPWSSAYVTAAASIASTETDTGDTGSPLDSVYSHIISAAVCEPLSTNSATLTDNVTVPSAMEVTETEEGNASASFISPRKTCSLASLLAARPVSTSVTTSNRYKDLPIQPTTSAEEAITAKASPTGAIPKQKAPVRTTTTPKTAPPTAKNANPPIVIQGVSINHKSTVAEFQKTIKKGFTIKYAQRSTLLYIKDPLEYKMYVQYLKKNSDIEFHTYATRDTKQHAFILRGLDGNPTVEDIVDDLANEHQLTASTIYPLKNTRKPLYMVVVDSDITLKHLQQTIKYVLHTRVSWERRYNTRPITQCRICQMWGHSQSGCSRSPKCVKCAGTHRSFSCTKPRDAPPKCANCGGAHTACNEECPVYQFRLQQLEARTTAPTTKPTVQLQPAPVPTQNPWTGAPRAAVGGAVATNQPATAVSNASRPPTQPASSGTSAAAPGQPVSEFSQLLAALQSLSSRVNISETLKAVQALDKMLINVSDPMRVISIMQEFAVNVLPQYNIIPVHSTS